MRGSRKHLILLVIGLLSLGTWAGAQGNQQNQQQNQDQPAMTTQARPDSPMQSGKFQPHVIRATDLVGMKVVNRQNEELGDIQEIVLNPERNKIAYGVLSYGGVLGLGEKYSAVPWDSFESKTGTQNLVLNIGKDTLNNAPGFDKNNWPDMANPRWKETVRKFYSPGSADLQGTRSGQDQTQAQTTPAPQDRMADRGEMRTDTETDLMADQTPRTDQGTMAQRPGQTERDTMTAEPGDMQTRDQQTRTAQTSPDQRRQQIFESRKLSELIGMPVNDPQGKNLADLEDVAVDMKEGRPVFGIVSLANDRMAAVPWSSLNIQPQTKTALLDADQQTLEAVAFNPDNFPVLSSREYASNVYSRFNREPYWSVYGYVSPGETQPQPGAEKRTTGWGPGTDYMKMFDPNQVTTIQGTIQSVGFFTPEKGAGPGERLRIRTQDGKTITAHLGPRSYLQEQNVSFKKGDQITITGAQTDIGGRSLIIASQVKKGDQTIQLRDDQGKPTWTSGGMGKANEPMPGQESQ